MSDPTGAARYLLEYNRQIDAAELFPSYHPAASTLVAEDPYAFALATCLDRGTKAEIIWTIPYYLQQDLGHLDPFRIHQMTLVELADLYARLPKRPRYINAAPRTTQELTRLVVERFNGDASHMWRGQSAAHVNRTFRSIYGVGEGIANVAVLLIEAAFGIRFSDRATMDIKPDVHTMRVLYRLGAAPVQTEWAAIQAARDLRPEYPGELDGALWLIGRRFCRPSFTRCTDCPMDLVCPKVGVS
jgi:endonuclease-3